MIKDKILRHTFKWFFSAFQRLGIHIVPNHYYFPVPDTRKLPTRLWSRVSDLPGISIRDDVMINLLEIFSSKYKDEYERIPKKKTNVPWQYYVNNEKFGPVDGEIYYCVIRHFKPKRIIEVGAGFSTLLALETIKRNREDGYDCELITIDPCPPKILKSLPGIKLIQKEVQELEVSEFMALSENDILFIDSSHVVKIGSDVVYLYLEVLPRLRKGVLIHVHDIFLPAEYPKQWVLDECRFWNEQYLLQAFLCFNENFEITWMGSYMHLKYSKLLENAFSSYNKNSSWPGSLWMRRIKGS